MGKYWYLLPIAALVFALAILGTASPTHAQTPYSGTGPFTFYSNSSGEYWCFVSGDVEFRAAGTGAVSWVPSCPIPAAVAPYSAPVTYSQPVTYAPAPAIQPTVIVLDPCSSFGTPSLYGNLGLSGLNGYSAFNGFNGGLNGFNSSFGNYALGSGCGNAGANCLGLLGCNGAGTCQTWSCLPPGSHGNGGNGQAQCPRHQHPVAVTPATVPPSFNCVAN